MRLMSDAVTPVPAGEASGRSRVFIALRPPPAVRAALFRYQRSCDWPKDAALVEPGKFHMTLHFLGDVPRPRLPEILSALQVPCAPFRLALTGPVLWPGGVAALGAAAAPEMVALREALAHKLQALGLCPDVREFRPHLTLARRARGVRWPEAPPGLWWQAGRYGLYESAHPASLPYKMLRSYPMRGSGPQEPPIALLENAP